jgi:hypothetical protein
MMSEPTEIIERRSGNDNRGTYGTHVGSLERRKGGTCGQHGGSIVTEPSSRATTLIISILPTGIK